MEQGSPRGEVRTLKAALFFQFFDKPVIHHLFSLEAADFFIARSQKADHIAQSLDVGIDAPLVEVGHALIAFVRVLNLGKAKPTSQTLHDQGFVSRILSKTDRLNETL